VAIILSVLENEVAADVLNFLPEAVRAETIQRVASLETVQPSAMAELESIMLKQFSNNTTAKSSSFGGVKQAAQIMNLTKTELEAQVMKDLRGIDPEMMQLIQDNMFTFDNLISVDNKGIQVLMRNVEPDNLMVALKGASQEVKDKFLGNVRARPRHVRRRYGGARTDAAVGSRGAAKGHHAHRAQAVRRRRSGARRRRRLCLTTSSPAKLRCARRASGREAIC